MPGRVRAGAGGGGGGGDTTATYLTLSSSATLTNEVIVREPFAARMQVDSGTQISLQRYAGALVVVNGEAVDPGSSGFTRAPSDNLIAGDGTDSGGNCAPNTTYYAYVSNSQASFSASSLRLSTTSPSLLNGVKYLATSGNGAHWRFAGWVRTNNTGTDGEFEDSLEKRLVVNYYNRLAKVLQLKPGHADDGLVTTFTTTSTTWVVNHGGNNGTAHYVANGEDSVHGVITAFLSNSNAGVLSFAGVGDNSTTDCIQEVFNPGGGTTIEIGTAGFIVNTPAEGYRTINFLTCVTANTGTYYGDSTRKGSSFDPRRTGIVAWVKC